MNYKRREQGTGNTGTGNREHRNRGQGTPEQGTPEQGTPEQGTPEQIRNTHLHQFRASVKKKMFLQDA